MITVDEVVATIRAEQDEQARAGMARYGINVDNAVGMSMPRPRALGKQIALMAVLAWKDKKADNEAFGPFLAAIEREAGDDRNFVKKAVNWALRHIGKRNDNLRGEAVAVARRLAASDSRAARWVGKDALRELESEVVRRSLGAT